MTDDAQNRWTCKFCHKSYSNNYKYKNHLSRCLVYTEKTEKEYDVMLELKQELKEELRKTFTDMLDDIKHEIKTGLTHQITNKVHQQQLQQPQQQPPININRRLLNAF